MEYFAATLDKGNKITVSALISANSCDFEDLLSNCESLKSSAGCKHELLKAKCEATCLCEDKIH